ncbi:conserved hypothetical protein [Neospora caninum Liverpool]|uniref:Uncharacterized protein n=1 Tax=Neospora caninum (strain Liverpool) TaxID=572307 RepID=F0V796_NEOCL|nr:conserved hypothetical protein [Neospora caninum Liverpool]CBZ49587.1 conserved hypothetical protein [Neospora caninum Liverpool]|eukprot:XP_003879622.1 conserved hypothetical protein [Neospora caninum Liverpool]
MNFHFRSSRLFCKASRSVHVRPNPPPEPPSGAPENSADSPRVQIRTDASLVADSTLTAAKATAARAVEEARQAGEAATAARRDAAQAAQAACLWKDRSVCPAGPVLEAQTQMPLCQLEESAELLLRLVSALTCRRGQEGKEEALALLADAVALFNHAEETRRRAEEATSRAAAARTRAAFFTREVEARERQKEEADRNSKGAEDHARRTPGGLSLPRGPDKRAEEERERSSAGGDGGLWGLAHARRRTRASSRLPSSYQERKSLFDGAPALAGTAQICVDFTAAASAEDERKRTDTEVTKREEGANLPQMFRFRTPNPRAAVKLLTSRPFVATFGDLLHKALQPILREGREAIRCTLPRDTGTRTGREEANGQHDAGPSSPNASLSHQRDKEGEERDSEEREGEPCHRSHNREETKKPAAERSKERRRSADRVRFADDEQEASVPAEKTEQSVSAEACAQNRVETLRIPTGRYLLTARDGAQRNAEGQSEPGDEGREHERPVESVNQERETDSQHADPQKTADDVAQHAATVPEQRKRLAAILQSRLWDVTRDVLSVYSVDPETRCSLPVAVAALLRLLADGFVLELEISNPVTALVRWPRVFRPCWLRLLLRFAPLRSLALWREAEAASDGRDERVQSIGNLGFKGEARIRGFECVLRRAGEPPPILCTIRQRLAKHLQLRRASIQTREEGWGSTSVNEEEGEAQQPSAKGEASHEPEGTEEEVSFLFDCPVRFLLSVSSAPWSVPSASGSCAIVSPRRRQRCGVKCTSNFSGLSAYLFICVGVSACSLVWRENGYSRKRKGEGKHACKATRLAALGTRFPPDQLA